MWSNKVSLEENFSEQLIHLHVEWYCLDGMNGVKIITKNDDVLIKKKVFHFKQKIIGQLSKSYPGGKGTSNTLSSL